MAARQICPEVVRQFEHAAITSRRVATGPVNSKAIIADIGSVRPRICSFNVEVVDSNPVGFPELSTEVAHMNLFLHAVDRDEVSADEGFAAEVACLQPTERVVDVYVLE